VGASPPAPSPGAAPPKHVIRAVQGAPLAPRRLADFRRRSDELAQRKPSRSYPKFWLGEDWRLIPDRLVPRIERESIERDVSQLMRFQEARKLLCDALPLDLSPRGSV
jgi:hypothetical protein